ncbi:MAG: hypothetical protein OQK94_02270 [Gammaproteobacteria bacterium]|nr:hypothetical protein [Gammaproteobacteria bacterium]MCW8959262.1 hypothetical protein [Gammaproteobacteria bacterium]MCW8973347.1 hypothetical protein [Gammaproteobacteria bacterium]MCW8992886.1 hypothetical protein [Gammaproteobacteria bacterium]
MSQQEHAFAQYVRILGKGRNGSRGLAAVWRGENSDEYGEAAVIGTVAIALYTMGKAENREEAEAQARTMWAVRDKARFASAA